MTATRLDVYSCLLFYEGLMGLSHLTSTMDANVNMDPGRKASCKCIQMQMS